MIVSQDLLATLKKRQAEMKEATRRYKQSRKFILDQHDAGAKAEPGRLGFRVTKPESCRFTIKNVMAALGKQGLEALRTRIPPTPSRTLKVFVVHEADSDDQS
jgi:hypothetical protein